VYVYVMHSMPIAYTPKRDLIRSETELWKDGEINVRSSLHLNSCFHCKLVGEALGVVQVSGNSV